MRWLLFFFLLLLFDMLVPAQAYAYLDPGTGNLLVYLVASIFGAGVYFLKDAFFFLKRKMGYDVGSRIQYSDKEGLIIFSEGKLYWTTFKPIIEALIDKGFHFRYYSMDIEDPALTIESPYMNSRYIGSGSAAFGRMAQIRGSLMLETTPNIGTPGYPMPAPRYIHCLAHVLHGIGDIGLYSKHAFDSCNTLITMNSQMEASVRHVETMRGLPQKECIPLGVPCFDEISRQVIRKKNISAPPVLLIAPSWGGKNCLAFYGTKFIAWLADAGYSIIIRPHPFSFSKEPGLIRELEDIARQYESVVIDTEVDSSKSLSSADVMISDKSGVRFDFAFLYGKPVITLDVPRASRDLFEISDLDYVWEDDVERLIGPVVKSSDLHSLTVETFDTLVKNALCVSSDSLLALGNEVVCNVGESGTLIADWAIEKCLQLAVIEEKTAC